MYYNNQTGTYYFYDETSKSYKFHSQVDVLPEENTNEQNDDKQDKPPKKKKKSKPTKKRKVIKVKSSSDEECSSGEIISTDEDDDDDDSDLDDDDEDDVVEEKVHKVAPCIRAIVTESDKLKIGTLFIITFTGGTLGRYCYQAAVISVVRNLNHHLTSRTQMPKRWHKHIFNRFLCLCPYPWLSHPC